MYKRINLYTTDIGDEIAPLLVDGSAAHSVAYRAKDEAVCIVLGPQPLARRTTSCIDKEMRPFQKEPLGVHCQEPRRVQ